MQPSSISRACATTAAGPLDRYPHRDPVGRLPEAVGGKHRTFLYTILTVGVNRTHAQTNKWSLLLYPTRTGVSMPITHAAGMRARNCVVM